MTIGIVRAAKWSVLAGRIDLGENNPRIPAGWTFLRQFVAHDITHDRSPLHNSEEVATLQNFHKPRLDLDCLYGASPAGSERPMVGQLAAEFHSGITLLRTEPCAPHSGTRQVVLSLSSLLLLPSH